jgi:hypothetical protein
MNGACYVAAKYALTITQSLPVQLLAVQTLCSTFVGSPQLILHSESDELSWVECDRSSAANNASLGLLRNLLSKRFNSAIHERLLRSLHNVMMTEEVSVTTTYSTSSI